MEHQICRPYLLLVYFLIFALLTNDAEGQITFSKSWQAGKRSEDCSLTGLHSLMKIHDFLEKETAELAKCRLAKEDPFSPMN
ncbi:uncharacterized protein LOC143229041 [Tachypleus tridentatus]|uniref:uncharacterized protein LOC143229041 n=1 Tax=Tachypleus tridentatus TaxID=6853 RepID=UPI003FD656D3